MAQQTLKRTAAGLVTNPNMFSEAPEGSLAEAENCLISRPGIVSKRRGFSVFGGPQKAAALFEYQGRLVSHNSDDSTLSYDSVGNGTWTAYAGSFSAPAAPWKMPSAETQGALLVGTSSGVMRTDGLTKTPIAAGMPYGLDVRLTVTGPGTGWLPPSSQVGYRVVWGRIDDNNRLLLGGPSMREVATNPINTALAWARSGAGPYTVTVTHPAHGYTTGDIVQVSDATPAGAAFFEGPQTITVTTSNAWTFSVGSDPGASGTLSAGKTQDVVVSFPLPDDLLDGDFYDIYHTEPSIAANVDPRDKQKRVIRRVIEGVPITMTASGATVTVTQSGHTFANGDVVRIYGSSDSRFDGKFIVGGVSGSNYQYTAASAPPASGTGKAWPQLVTVTDDWDLPLTDVLYTNLDQETVDQANSRPPYAKTFALYRGLMHYGNTRKQHHIELQLTDVTGLVDGTSSLTLARGGTSKTYTFATAEAVSTRSFKRYTSFSTLAQNIAATMKSFCRVVNLDPTSLWYASYISGINDAPGLVAVEARTLDAAEFTLISNNATTANKFTPNVPTSGSLYVSENEVGTNRLYYAKVDQPEAAPDLNWDAIGEDSNEILKVLPTRDSLIVATKRGVYRKAGTTEAGFVVEGLDLTIEARAPNTWCLLNNAVFGIGTAGVYRITEAGTQLVSWSIQDKIGNLIQFPSYESLAFAVPYEAENLYVLWLPEKATDTTATVAYAYHTINRTWTGPWRRAARAAYVPVSGKLYVSRADNVFPRVLQERRSTDNALADYMDEDLPVTVTAAESTIFEDATRSLVTVSGWPYPDLPEVGWLFRADPALLPYSKIVAIENPTPGVYTITLEDYFPGISAGDAVVTRAIKQRVRWQPEAAGNVATMKHFQDVQVYHEKPTATHNRLGYFSDIDTTERFYGELVFGSQAQGGRMIRDTVPSEYQRARALSLVYENVYGQEAADILWVGYTVRITGEKTLARAR